MEGDAGNLAILGGFHDLQGAGSDFEGEVALHRLGLALHIEGNNILIGIPQPVFRAAGDHTGDGRGQALFGGNGPEFRFTGGNVQLIPIHEKIHAGAAEGEITQHIVLIHQRRFIFPGALVVLQGMGIGPNRTGVVCGKGRDRAVVHHVFPQGIEDGLRCGAVGGDLVHDLALIPCAKLVVGNEPDEDLGGDVLIDGAAPVLCAGFHVVAQGEGSVDQRLLFFCERGVIIRGLVADAAVGPYTHLDAVGGAVCA